ncbi:MAG: type I methionyl aminopeptidase [Candidatus Doudnabacteria bacterium]|nr:type I methionyl aminopeptidase [Candidatus Doudnabacteria bacterium]
MKRGLIKTAEEIEIIAEGGRLLRDVLYAAAGMVRPGISTWDLNQFAEKEIKNAGGRPSFKNYGDKSNPFPAGLCTSINSVIVHGIPSRQAVLKEGDIVGLDIGMEYKGLYTDTAITVPVGKISAKAQKLVDATKKSLNAAIAEARPGNTIGDIAYATQKIAENAGFSVVRDLVGHGVGYEVHEDPAVPNYGKKGQGMKLAEGLVIAIEPMLCEHEYFIVMENDGWTISTRDGGLSAHFEHTVAITKNGARILT